MRRFFLLGEFLLLSRIAFGAYLWQQITDVRALSLGNSLLGNPEYGSDLLNNPAIHYRIKKIYFSHLSQDNDSHQQVLTAQWCVKNYQFGVGLIYSTVEEILSYDRNKNYLGKTAVKEYLFAGNFSRERILSFNEFWVNLGINLEYFSSTLDRYSGQAFLLNPGVVVVNEVNYPLFAFVLNYPLNEIRYYQATESLPAIVKFSCGYLAPAWAENFNLEFGIIYNQPDKLQYFTAGEYKIFQMIFARLGINLFSYPTLSPFFSYGLGFNIADNFFLDYSFRQIPDFANRHFFGLTVKFSASKSLISSQENHFIRGKKLFQSGKYAESILELNQALDEQPDNQEILELMRRASEYLKTK